MDAEAEKKYSYDYGTIEQVMKYYRVSESRLTIVSPGKFQGEPIYAPYFSAFVLDSCQDDMLVDDPRYPGIGIVDVFDVTGLDSTLWPQLKGVDRVYCFTDDMGFFHTEIVERS
jgi:hypothetical protein